jgi:quercetin dioxygenase-like cupin family protein
LCSEAKKGVKGIHLPLKKDPPCEKVPVELTVRKNDRPETIGGYRMKITRLDEVERTRMTMEGAKDVWKQVPISRNDGSPSFSFRVFTIAPGGHTPFHSHPFEHLNYIIEGQGILVTEQGTEHEVRRGDFALVLPDEKHQYRNNSDSEALIMICAVPKAYE